MQNIAPALLTSLWQSALTYLLFYTVRRSSHVKPNQTYVIGLGMQFLLTIHFFIQILANDNRQISEVSSYFNNSYISILNTYISYSYAILLIINIGLQFYKEQLFKSSLQNNIDSSIALSLLSNIEKLKCKLGIKRPVRLLIKNNIVSPFTKGILKPIIALPISLITGLNAEQMEVVLLHELSHVKRYDYIFLLFQTGMERIFYFNPFFLLIGKAIREDRELSCDILSLKSSNYNSISYIETLLFISKNTTDLNPSLARSLKVIGNKKSELFNRTAYLLEKRKNNHFAGKFWMGSIAAIAFLLGTNSWQNRPLQKALPITNSSPNIREIKSDERHITIPITSQKNSTTASILGHKSSKKSQKTNRNYIKQYIDNKHIDINFVKNKPSPKSKIAISNTVTNEIALAPEKVAKPELITENTSLLTTRKDWKLEPILTSNGSHIFVLHISDPSMIQQAYTSLINSIQKHFMIKSASFQYASVVSNNTVQEHNTTTLQSDKYNFTVSKQDNFIQLHIDDINQEDISH